MDVVFIDEPNASFPGRTTNIRVHEPVPSPFGPDITIPKPSLPPRNRFVDESLKLLASVSPTSPSNTTSGEGRDSQSPLLQGFCGCGARAIEWSDRVSIVTLTASHNEGEWHGALVFLTRNDPLSTQLDYINHGLCRLGSHGPSYHAPFMHGTRAMLQCNASIVAFFPNSNTEPPAMYVNAAMC
jgi:hypothetical protein